MADKDSRGFEAATAGPQRPEYEPKTPDQALGYLVEEFGEVLAAIGKTQRWGPFSINPELKRGDPLYGETNRDWVLRELNDAEAAIERARRFYGVEASRWVDDLEGIADPRSTSAQTFRELREEIAHVRQEWASNADHLHRLFSAQLARADSAEAELRKRMSQDEWRQYFYRVPRTGDAASERRRVCIKRLEVMQFAMGGVDRAVLQEAQFLLANPVEAGGISDEGSRE